MNGYQLREIDYSELTNIKERIILDKENENFDYFNTIYGYSMQIIESQIMKDRFILFSSDIQNRGVVYIFDFINNILINLKLLWDDEFGSEDIVYINNENDLFFTIKNSTTSFPSLSMYTLNIDEYEKLIKENSFETIGQVYKNSNNSNIKIIKSKETLVKFITKIDVLKTNVDSCFNKDLIENELILRKQAIDKNEKETDKDKCLLKWNDTPIFTDYILSIFPNIKINDEVFNGYYGYSVKLDTETSIKRPLVYIIHGGPNSSYTQEYSKFFIILLTLGYDLLITNYPGSSGFGQNYLHSLNGKIGELDVSACGEYMKSFLIKYENIYDNNKIFLYGGSHGGFLSAWLSVHSEYSKLFKAALIINPVVNIYSLFTSSDIPDWAYELSLNKELEFGVSDDDIIKMMSQSPIKYSSQAQTSIFLLIGGVDLRVTPNNNGINFYHSLKFYNKDVKMKLYPTDDHPLSSPETNIDVIYSMVDYLEEFNKN